MRLENWSIVQRNPDPYKAPELQRQYLHGKIFGHPDYEDGTEITTSAIWAIRDNLIITKSGSEYALGEVDPKYEAAFPDARNRLL